MEKRLLNVEELSQYIGTPSAVLYKWVSQRKIPFVKLGRSTRFDLEMIDLWIQKNSKFPEKHESKTIESVSCRIEYKKIE